MPEGLLLKYFVLKPSGTDRYAQASRKAMRAYASHIYAENEQLAEDLWAWVNRESEAAIEQRDKDGTLPDLKLPD